MGTIVRTAGAAGAHRGGLCAGAVDVFNPKTVRSSAGMLFHLPVVVAGDVIEVLDEVGRWGLRRWGTAARSGCDYTEVDLVQPTALVRRQRSPRSAEALDAHLDGILRIPMAGSADSLNVATAAGVVLRGGPATPRSAPTRRCVTGSRAGRGRPLTATPMTRPWFPFTLPHFPPAQLGQTARHRDHC